MLLAMVDMLRMVQPRAALSSVVYPPPAFKDKLIFTHLVDSGDGGDGAYDYGAMFYLDKW